MLVLSSAMRLLVVFFVGVFLTLLPVSGEHDIGEFDFARSMEDDIPTAQYVGHQKRRRTNAEATSYITEDDPSKKWNKGGAATSSAMGSFSGYRRVVATYSGDGPTDAEIAVLNGRMIWISCTVFTP